MTFQKHKGRDRTADLRLLQQFSVGQIKVPGHILGINNPNVSFRCRVEALDVRPGYVKLIRVQDQKIFRLQIDVVHTLYQQQQYQQQQSKQYIQQNYQEDCQQLNRSISVRNNTQIDSTPQSVRQDTLKKKVQSDKETVQNLSIKEKQTLQQNMSMDQEVLQTADILSSLKKRQPQEQMDLQANSKRKICLSSLQKEHDLKQVQINQQILSRFNIVDNSNRSDTSKVIISNNSLIGNTEQPQNTGFGCIQNQLQDNKVAYFLMVLQQLQQQNISVV